MYRNLVKIPVGLINEAHQKGWLLSLSYFVSFKSIHANNQIYNYSSRVLAKKLNIANATVNFHVNKLKSLGLASMIGDNLVFLGEAKLVSLAKSKKLLPFMDKVRVVSTNRESILKSHLVKLNNREQQYRIDQYEKYKTLKRLASSSAYMSKEDARKYLKLRKLFKATTETRKNYTNISCSGVARLTNTHHCTGFKMRKLWESLGIITMNRKYEFVKKGVTYAEYKIYKKIVGQDNPSMYNKLFYSKGCIMKSCTNEVVFSSMVNVSGLKSSSVKIKQS